MQPLTATTGEGGDFPTRITVLLSLSRIPFLRAADLRTFRADNVHWRKQNLARRTGPWSRCRVAIDVRFSRTAAGSTLAKVFLQSICFAITLVCLSASLMFASQCFELLPDVAKLENDSRRRLSEAIAIQTAPHIPRRSWADLRPSLKALVDRNENLLSIGVRDEDGYLKAEAGQHQKLWTQVAEGRPAIDPISMPITQDNLAWGTVEFCFRSSQQSLAATIAAHPLMRFLTFFCILGLVGYAVFVGIVTRAFGLTQVVPDRVRQALDTLAEGFLVMDEQANIILANRAFAQTVDVPDRSLVETCANDLPWKIDGDSTENNYPWMRAIGESATLTEQILHLNVGEGKARIFSVNASPFGGASKSQRGALATFRDVTHIEEHRAELERMLSMLRASRDEIEDKNRELEILATQDALTGCLNRRAFFERFSRLWKEAIEQQRPLSCLMIDNDHFKTVNDTYGHSVGDDVLRQVARVLREHHSKQGLVCRYGGEEFCVLLPGMTFQQAIELAEQTRRAVEEIPFQTPSELRLTVSIGVSETRFKATEPQELINQADICLYAAKRQGRNCVVPYSDELAHVELNGSAHQDHDRIEIPYQAVEVLLASLSFRDPCTANHCRRVAELCNRVAEQLPQPIDRDLLEVAALLHDIGKVGVSDEILLKPGEWTAAEHRLITEYDRVGVELIENAFDCDRLTEIVRHRDTPFADHGRHLPSEARLLGICNRYDERVFGLSTRSTWLHEAAIEELRREAPAQFDPELVEHFAEVIERPPAEPEHHSAQHVAAGIAFHIERLAEAIEDQDASGIRSLSAHLVRYARRCEAEIVAASAERIHRQAIEEHVQWLELIKETQHLMQYYGNALSGHATEPLSHQAAVSHSDA